MLITIDFDAGPTNIFDRIRSTVAAQFLLLLKIPEKQLLHALLRSRPIVLQKQMFGGNWLPLFHHLFLQGCRAPA